MRRVIILALVAGLSACSVLAMAPGGKQTFTPKYQPLLNDKQRYKAWSREQKRYEEDQHKKLYRHMTDDEWSVEI